MAILHNNVVPFVGGEYTIDQSLRFEDGSSAYLSRTPASAGNRKTWTWSGWVKLGNIDSAYFTLFSAGDYNNSQTRDTEWVSIDGNGNIFWGYAKRVSGTYTTQSYVYSDAVLRDPSAWYHIVIRKDVSNATTADRIIFYVNGVRQSVSVTAGVVDIDGQISRDSTVHRIGMIDPLYAGGESDGYLSEVHFIDGQALTPDYFGEVDETYGHWKPIEYTGTYGTNGFYLPFSGTFYNDASGNGNNWTANNLATTDVVLDTPTNNFCTWNSVQPQVAVGTSTYSEGNLRVNASDGNYGSGWSTFQLPNSGKYYFEYYHEFISSPSTPYIAVFASDGNLVARMMCAGTVWDDSNIVYTNGTTHGTGDTVSVAANLDDNEYSFYLNGSFVYTVTTSAYQGAGGYVRAYLARGASSYPPGDTTIVNFGQDSSFAGNKTAQNNTDANGYGDFYYSPPSGFLALCTANLSDPAVVPAEHFNTVLYAGNGGTQSITGVGFSPDLVWIKSRDGTSSHRLQDSVRGAGKELYSNLTNAEATQSTSITSFDSNGFSLGSLAGVNYAGGSYVAWCWDAGSSTVSNTDGSITSTVAANPDAGFSIVSYTGANSSGANTVGHGLSSAPEMIIVKSRDSSGSTWNAWVVGHSALGWGDSSTLTLNTTSAKFDGYGSTPWNNTAPTSSVFSVSSSAGAGVNYLGEDYIAYCFHSVDGYSKFGSYTGNGSTDGPFVYTGFRPAFVMVKRTDAAFSWYVRDTARETYNVMDQTLAPNTSAAEDTAWGGEGLDFVSNGFKVTRSNVETNASGGTFIYMAFAEYPFSKSNAR